MSNKTTKNNSPRIISPDYKKIRKRSVKISDDFDITKTGLCKNFPLNSKHMDYMFLLTRLTATKMAQQI